MARARGAGANPRGRGQRATPPAPKRSCLRVMSITGRAIRFLSLEGTAPEGLGQHRRRQEILQLAAAHGLSHRLERAAVDARVVPARVGEAEEAPREAS